MKKKNFAKRSFSPAIAGSIVGVVLSRLVINPLIHIVSDPPWLSPMIIAGVLISGTALVLYATY